MNEDLIVYLDFETYYDSEYSLTKMPTCSYVRDPRFETQGVGLFIPTMMDNPRYYEPNNLRRVLAGLPWEKVVLVCHNTKFDGFILAMIYGHIPKRYVDTMDMAAAVFGTSVRSLGLDALAKHIGLTHGKIQGALSMVKGVRFAEFTDIMKIKMNEYCRMDCVLLYALHLHLLSLTRAFTLQGETQEDWNMDTVIRMFCVPSLELDKYLLEQIHETEVANAEKLIASTGCTATQLRSSIRFKTLLEELGVAVQQKRSLTPTAIKKKKTTGEDTFIPALAKNDDFFVGLLEHGDERVANLARARQVVNSNITRTRARSYADVAGEGPWPVDLKYSGARVTHRLSGSGGGGGNPQNLGRGSPLRDAIIAPEGKKIVVADLSAIELRTSACISGERDLIETIRANDANPKGTKDAYVTFAETHVFRRALADKELFADTYKTERTTGKVSILSCGYGSGGGTFRGMLRAMGKISVTLERAEELVKIYRAAHPNYVETWRWLNDYVLARMANPSAQPEGLEQLRPGLPLWVDYKGQQIFSHSGLALKYPNLRREMRYNPFLDKDMLQYVYDDYTKGGVAFVYGPKMLGNLSQFTAREVIMYQMGILRQSYPVALSVHDENACVVWEHEAQTCLDKMLEIMTTPLPWWPDLPLNAEGAIGSNYGEAK